MLSGCLPTCLCCGACRFGMLEACRLLTDEGRRALIGTSLLLDIISERSVGATRGYLPEAV